MQYYQNMRADAFQRYKEQYSALQGTVSATCLMSALSNQGTFASAYRFLGAISGKENIIRPHSSHLTAQTSHLTSHTSYPASHTSHTSHLTPHSSNFTPYTSRLTPHTSHLTPHTSCLDHTLYISRLRLPDLPPETSDVTPHITHLTPGVSHLSSRSQTSCIPRQTGKFVRLGWHGDDAT